MTCLPLQAFGLQNIIKILYKCFQTLPRRMPHSSPLTRNKIYIWYLFRGRHADAKIFSLGLCFIFDTIKSLAWYDIMRELAQQRLAFRARARFATLSFSRWRWCLYSSSHFRLYRLISHTFVFLFFYALARWDAIYAFIRAGHSRLPAWAKRNTAAATHTKSREHTSLVYYLSQNFRCFKGYAPRAGDDMDGHHHGFNTHLEATLLPRGYAMHNFRWYGRRFIYIIILDERVMLFRCLGAAAARLYARVYLGNIAF